MTVRAAVTTVVISAALFALATPAAADPIKNIVLVHGAFADGSGWHHVANILRKDGFSVSIVQQPLTTLAEDVAATNRVIDRADGPVVLVGHSFGGAVITEAGNNPNVKSLVYVAAFMPDAGESAGQLATQTPSATKGIAPTKDGFLFVDPALFPADFAADVPKAEAEFLAISQEPVAGQEFGTPIKTAAWKTKPTWAIVSTQDRMINPDSERAMYKRANSKVTEVKASHAVFLSKPKAVAAVIEDAARNTK
jgi:pimeloyl-ACP methyl ester carboxylesterase